MTKISITNIAPKKTATSFKTRGRKPLGINKRVHRHTIKNNPFEELLWKELTSYHGMSHPEEMIRYLVRKEYTALESKLHIIRPLLDSQE